MVPNQNIKSEAKMSDNKVKRRLRKASVKLTSLNKSIDILMLIIKK